MSLAALKKIKIKKLKALKKAGFEIYPLSAKRTHACQEALDLMGGQRRVEFEKETVYLVGRLKSIRSHGSSSFAHLEDGTAALQLYLKKDILGLESYRLFLDNLEVGDFIEASGHFFETKTGEKTLKVNQYRILAKALLPLPENWYGLKDKEERFRKRYLDLLINQEVRKKIGTRSQIVKDIRFFLEKEGFMEVETPILQLLPGGATARPFKTQLNALNMDLYLRVAPELFLKRLLVGGFEKVYEIGRCFRNEGMDFSHNPDFTMLEFYWAYADYEDLMKLTERLFQFLAPSLEFVYGDKKINLISPWPRLEFGDLLKKEIGLEIKKTNDEECLAAARKLGLKLNKKEPRLKILDEIYKKICRPKLIQPTFVIHHPSEMSPLAKSLPNDPNRAARFQLVIAGLELVNAYSELNDPLEQEKRMREQEKLRFKGKFEEAHRYDEDFIGALKYGMPPAAGFGLGIDRLVALLTDSHAVREIILFPLMKPKKT